MPLSKIGVAGLGARGRAIGSRLRTAGFRVIGFDPNVQAAATSGVRTAGSVERLAGECEVVLVALDGAAAAAQADELVAVSNAGALQALVLAGTLDPREVRRLTASAAEKDIPLLDAPMDGGEEAVAAGRAAIFAGGSQVALDACKGVFDALGTTVRVGEAGSGQLARIVNDLLYWANVLAVHEAFGLAQACGAEPSPLRDAVLRASGSNRALEEWGRAGIETAGTDIQATLLLAREAGVAMPFLERMDDLLKDLEPARMAGLFTLGIADLTKKEVGG